MLIVVALIATLLPLSVVAGDASSGSLDGVRYFFDTDQRVVALTIDDGPDPNTTRNILEVLAQHDARATFFLIADHIPGNEDLVGSIVAAGHEIANHMTRDERSTSLPIEKFEQEFIRADAVLSRWTDPVWFRPGSGWYNRDMLEVAKKHGYRTALGTLYPLDAWISSPKIASNFILLSVFSGGIIILHDRGARGARTTETLTEVLPELRKRGFAVVTLSELARIANVEREPD